MPNNPPSSDWLEQFEIDNYNGVRCNDCKWNSPNITQCSFCPSCGSDQIIQGEGAKDAIEQENQKRWRLQVSRLQPHGGFDY